MLDDADVDLFLDAPKQMVGTLEWQARHDGASFIASAPVQIGGLEEGDVQAVQVNGSERNWIFKLRMGGETVLQHHYDPPDKLRCHSNRGELPPGYVRKDRSLVHEHPWCPDGKSPLSKGLTGLDDADHAEAFGAFCQAAGVDPKDGYRPPPAPQLAFPA